MEMATKSRPVRAAEAPAAATKKFSQPAVADCRAFPPGRRRRA
ncbi:MAG TPA: hypothetical protein VEJ89_18040 [Myxococcaceae bacterium]|nr:hypothetical protein [Myxococcaceae bacterium]